MSTDGDPTVVRSVAVTVEDVVTALELNRSTPREAVLRVTPPFSGRMRARLHVATVVDDDDTLHIDPDTLVGPAAPAYPNAADTEKQLRADPTETYTVERHHEHHVDALADWRRAVVDAIKESATIHVPTPHDIEVTTLGDLSEYEPPTNDESPI